MAVLLPFSLPDVLQTTKRQDKSKIRSQFGFQQVYIESFLLRLQHSIVSHVRNGPRLLLPLFPILPHPPLADGARDVM